MRRMEHIGHALSSFLKGTRLDRRLHEQQVVLAWPRLVGPEVAAHSTATQLRRGMLWVTVSGSTWVQHIQFLKPKIQSALRQEFPEIPVRDIRCVVGDPAETQRGSHET